MDTDTIVKIMFSKKISDNEMTLRFLVLILIQVLIPPTMYSFYRLRWVGGVSSVVNLSLVTGTIHGRKSFKLNL